MHVIATAGHVDHGKSTLIRALTGIETDRWEEEQRRGLTIDLGFAWCTLPSGRGVSFVDVPGHERFIGNMLAGLGPVPIVLFVVAADEGWSAQSSDHRDAVKALGISHGIIVVTRADRAPDRVEAVIAEARRELADTGLAHAPACGVSGVTGEGIDALRSELDALVASVAAASPHESVRLWIDRSFTIDGAGTVVTGTLGAGTVRPGDDLILVSTRHDGAEPRKVSVRGVQSRGAREDAVEPVSRAALNLRQIPASDIHRGDVLLTPEAFHLTRVVDVRSVSGDSLDDIPRETMIHVGSAAVNARVRPLGADHARLTFDKPLPLVIGDRLVMRGTGERAVLGGVRVLDVDPPELRRRGAGSARETELEHMSEHGDARREIERRGAILEKELRKMGFEVSGELEGVVSDGGWLVSDAFLENRGRALRERVAGATKANALRPGLSRKEAFEALALPAPDLLPMIVRKAALVERDGLIVDPSVQAGLGEAEASVATLEAKLKRDPFNAPELGDLAALGLSAKELAAAAKQGRLLRIGQPSDNLVLLPTAPALAMRELAALPQPFTTSQARRALGTTRRTVIPLLEHLDKKGWTRRIDAGHREIVR
ncbi:selenocysteine-specific translation elongation factor [Dermabacter sp. HSID17554]|uniref:selenocysteine-specific translation elongation factor n=1 Tax=Dermabacter sp. HSID17554 TaxID=2419511 RepID=UPI000F870ED8|nr:selenocysteine-specific translation elongation factor [Dermabacter sp. HSID17554]RUP86046.1 selenocysteine-specific translation elongation factor [Dermabacter sp. HSID17554]